MRILFAGTPDFSVVPLDALIASTHQLIGVFTQPDRPAGRGKSLRASPVKARALAAELPIWQPESLKDEGIKQQLTELAPDVMVVVAYGQLIPDWLLALPKFGCLNIHASLLPRWRGAAPIQRALAAGDKETGVTIMQMDAGLDTGDMLLKRSTPISLTDTGGSLHDRLATLGAEALLDVLEQLPLSGETQDNAASCYASKLKKQEARLDWDLPAETLHRQIRAFNPWPVSFTDIDNKRVRLWEADCIEAGDNNQTDQPPGTIIACHKAGVDVACGSKSGHLLRLKRLQLQGKKPMDAAAIMNGHGILFSAGKRFS